MIIGRDLPRKPEFYYRPPQKRTNILLSDNFDVGESIDIPSGAKTLVIESVYEERGFSGRDANVDITIYCDEKDNPDYDAELFLYNKRLEDYQKELIKWEETCKEINLLNEKREREIYEKLKEKFG